MSGNIVLLNHLVLAYFFVFLYHYIILFLMYFQSAHTIRNYINPLDHAASGFVFGATYRLIGGPKAMLGNQINMTHMILKMI